MPCIKPDSNCLVRMATINCDLCVCASRVMCMSPVAPCQAELAASRKSLASHEALMRKMSDQLLQESEAVLALKADLAREQTLARSLKERLSKVRGWWA